MFLSQPANDVIKNRFSSPSYLGEPITAGHRQQMTDFLPTIVTWIGR